MKSSEIEVGEWYRVKWKEYSDYDPRIVQGRVLATEIGQLSSEEWKEAGYGSLWERPTAAGWHRFEVMSGGMHNDYKMTKTNIHAKSVLSIGEDPIPKPGSRLYKKWVQQGIDEALAEKEKQEHAELMRHLAGFIEGYFQDPEDMPTTIKYNTKVPFATSVSYDGKTLGICLPSSKEAQKLMDFIQTGVKHKLLDSLKHN